ncbi:hypothetical protein QJQ45_027392, partial [Haematococcus lacustris]
MDSSAGPICAQAAGPGLLNASVLLVEDDLTTLRTVEQLLRKFNYRVTTAANGREAIQLLLASRKPGAKPFDLVLTDLLMPEVSGFQLIHEVLHGTAFCDVPVVVMSSADSQASVLQAFEAGAADYLIKPVRRNEVATLWQHVWRAHRSKAAAVPQPPGVGSAAAGAGQHGSSTAANAQGPPQPPPLAAHDGSPTQQEMPGSHADTAAQQQQQQALLQETGSPQQAHDQPGGKNNSSGASTSLGDQGEGGPGAALGQHHSNHHHRQQQHRDGHTHLPQPAQATGKGKPGPHSPGEQTDPGPDQASDQIRSDRSVGTGTSRWTWLNPQQPNSTTPPGPDTRPRQACTASSVRPLQPAARPDLRGQKGAGPRQGRGQDQMAEPGQGQVQGREGGAAGAQSAVGGEEVSAGAGQEETGATSAQLTMVEGE